MIDPTSDSSNEGMKIGYPATLMKEEVRTERFFEYDLSTLLKQEWKEEKRLNGTYAPDWIREWESWVPY